MNSGRREISSGDVCPVANIGTDIENCLEAQAAKSCLQVRFAVLVKIVGKVVVIGEILAANTGEQSDLHIPFLVIDLRGESALCPSSAGIDTLLWLTAQSRLVARTGCHHEPGA